MTSECWSASANRSVLVLPSNELPLKIRSVPGSSSKAISNLKAVMDTLLLLAALTVKVSGGKTASTDEPSGISPCGIFSPGIENGNERLMTSESQPSLVTVTATLLLCR